MDIYSILASKPHNKHYLDRYWKFIQSCQEANKNLPKETYVERHHICPKAKDLFPEYTDFKVYNWNEIRLTGRQHYLAHYILAKCFGGSQMLTLMTLFVVKNSRLYQKHKYELSALISESNRLHKPGKLTVEDINTGKKFQVTSEEYRNNKNLISLGTGKVNVTDTFKGITYQIAKEEWLDNENPDIVTFSRSGYKIENTENMQGPKEADHAQKLKDNLDNYREDFICALDNRKSYTKCSWGLKIRLLEDEEFKTKRSRNSSIAMTGKPKTTSHKKNLSEAKKISNSINRVCDLNTKKEMSVAAFLRNQNLIEIKSVERVCDLITKKEMSTITFKMKIAKEDNRKQNRVCDIISRKEMDTGSFNTMIKREDNRKQNGVS